MLLIAPGLLAHAAACSAHGAFARLACYAPQPTRELEGIAHLACAALGVATAPIAALTASGAGVDAGDFYWLMAEPVTLVASRSDVAIAGRAQSLTHDEAQELLIALNAHFHDDGMDFVAPRPGLWLARLKSAPAIVTTSLDRACAGRLVEALPRGEARAQWRRWQDEIQMLLHNHPVNQVREHDGTPPANGVWFWGGGRLADAVDTPALDIEATESTIGDMMRGIARAPHPAGAAARRVIVHPRIDATADVDAFARNVLAPALGALERREIAALDLVADGVGVALAWHAPAPTTLRRLSARWRSGSATWSAGTSP